MANSTPTYTYKTLAGLRDLLVIKMSNNQKGNYIWIMLTNYVKRKGR